MTGGVIYGLHRGDGRIRYVGKTSKEPRARLAQHVNAALAGRGFAVHDWMRKYGPAVVEMEILDRSDDDEALSNLEREWIVQLGTLAPSGLNLTPGGDGVVGRTFTDAQRSALSKAHIGLRHSEATRKKMSLTRQTHGTWNKGLRGELNPQYGKKNPGASRSASERKGELNPTSKLTESDIRQIFEKRFAGMLVRDIALEHGIAVQYASELLRRKFWAHVDIPKEIADAVREMGRAKSHRMGQIAA